MEFSRLERHGSLELGRVASIHERAHHHEKTEIHVLHAFGTFGTSSDLAAVLADAFPRLGGVSGVLLLFLVGPQEVTAVHGMCVHLGERCLGRSAEFASAAFDTRVGGLARSWLGGRACTTACHRAWLGEAMRQSQVSLCDR